MLLVAASADARHPPWQCGTCSQSLKIFPASSGHSTQGRNPPFGPTTICVIPASQTLDIETNDGS